MKTIDNDIKNMDFKKAYLLYGQERYLIKQYRDKLIKAMVNDGDSMNFSSFEGDGINQKEIIDLAETLPFLRCFLKKCLHPLCWMYRRKMRFLFCFLVFFLKR